MKEIVKKTTSLQKTDFSKFFLHSSKEEKRKLLEEVVREANEDQRAIVEEYDKRFAKAA